MVLLRHVCLLLPYVQGLNAQSSPSDLHLASQVMNILSNVVPRMTSSPSIEKEFAVLEKVLLWVIWRKGSGDVRVAIRCLSTILVNVLLDFSNIAKLLDYSIPSLTPQVMFAIRSPKPFIMEMSIRPIFLRHMWMICCLLEYLDIDNNFTVDHNGKVYLKNNDKSLQFNISIKYRLSSQDYNIPIAYYIIEMLIEIFFKMTDDSGVIPEESLDIAPYIVQCIGFILCRHLHLVKLPMVSQVFDLALSTPLLQSKALASINNLLEKFADAAKNNSNASANNSINENEKEEEELSPGGSIAAQSAQPLACYLGAISDILKRTDVNPFDAETNRLKRSALKVMVELNKHGLINPQQIIAPVFSALFWNDENMQNVAYKVLKTSIDRWPSMLINRLGECLRCSTCVRLSYNFALFEKDNKNIENNKNIEKNNNIEKVNKGNIEDLLLISMKSLGGLHRFCDLYAEKFRQSKPSREKILQSLFTFFETVDIETDRKAVENIIYLNNKDNLLLYWLMKQNLFASIFLALPYIYESEVLFIIYLCNNFLSYRSRSFCLDDECSVKNENIIKDENIIKNEESTPPPKIIKKTIKNDIIKGKNNLLLTLAVSLTTGTLVFIKKNIKKYYNISDNRCISYRPSDTYRIEKPKYRNEDEMIIGDLSLFLGGIYNVYKEKYNKPQLAEQMIRRHIEKLLDDDSCDANVDFFEENANRTAVKPRRRKSTYRGAVTTAKKKTKAMKDDEDFQVGDM
eukprot:GHVL01019914.1.p1 GENE.GHVL01019914.1~~GHVL01019914.1.p1  ORF type:complete len:742 (-),score=221.67 GHVL01019914.1:138-2363(-)